RLDAVARVPLAPGFAQVRLRLEIDQIPEKEVLAVAADEEELHAMLELVPAGNGLRRTQAVERYARQALLQRRFQRRELVAGRGRGHGPERQQGQEYQNPCHDTPRIGCRGAAGLKRVRIPVG